MSNYPSPHELDDMVNHPSHYAVGWSNGAEVIDITENLNFNRGNAVKYIARAGKKADELEDLRKAAWYLDREIQRVSSGQPVPQELNESNVNEAVEAYEGVDPSTLADWERELLGLTRQWDSLKDVPIEVKVLDVEGDLWEFRRTQGWGYYESGIFERVGANYDRDDYAPFTEVLV